MPAWGSLSMRREEVFESSTAISSTRPGNAAEIAMTTTFWCCLCNRQKTGHANFYGDDGDEAAFFDRVGKMSVQKLVSFLNARGCLDEKLGKVPEGELASHRTAALKQYLGRLDTAATVAYQPPGHPACLCCDGCLRRKKALKGAAVGLVAGAGAALLAGPALAAVGFTTAGVAAGSWAAGFQSAVYGAYTAAVPFGVLQSVGAAGGLSASAVAGTAAATAVGGAALNSTRSSATKDETTTRDDRLVYRSKEGAVQGGDEVIHHGYRCNSCDVNPIRGMRFHCTVRTSYDLCSSCEALDDETFPMIKHRVAQKRQSLRQIKRK